MGVDPNKMCLFIPPHLAGFKQKLFNRIGEKVGKVVRHDFDQLRNLDNNHIPVVGCTPELKPIIAEWRAKGKQWCYWDRGYMRRIFATDLPTGDEGGYYRWHLNGFQMDKITDVPDDRWKAMKMQLWPWARNGKHIVIAEPSPTYAKFHGIEKWTEETIGRLKNLTDRPIVSRTKEMQRFSRKLHEDLENAHALVTHGSNAAVESVIMGCPVFVDNSSAAKLVGKTNLDEIENPIYPDREAWVKSLCYNQFNEKELVDGTLWRLIQ